MANVDALPVASLHTAPGKQLQGINVQGIDINKDYCCVNIDWVDPDTKLNFDPNPVTMTVTKDSSPYTVQKVMVPLSRVDDSVGVWQYAFLTNGMDAGTYTFTFVGTIPGTAVTVTHVLGFTAADIPVEQYFVGALRTKLWDKRASRYLIDDNQRTRWTNGELYSFCDNARLQIGQMPPAPELITWEMGYVECHDLILTGGFIGALEAAGVFETWNRFSYVDELSLNIDRSAFFQNAQSLRQQWLLAITAWRRDRLFHTVRGVGMASGKFPQYYTRILSISMANAGNVFYG